LRLRIDVRVRGVALLILLSAISGWLERRPPAWFEADPLLQPFGLPAPPDEAAELDSILLPPVPPPPPPPAVIDPNSASREQWIALPGIGPATADRIGEWLESGRRFRRAEDLEHVRGIGPKRIEQIRPWLEFPDVPDGSSKSPVGDRPTQGGI
jgi:hypothetical protein